MLLISIQLCLDSCRRNISHYLPRSCHNTTWFSPTGTISNVCYSQTTKCKTQHTCLNGQGNGIYPFNNLVKPSEQLLLHIGAYLNKNILRIYDTYIEIPIESVLLHPGIRFILRILFDLFQLQKKLRLTLNRNLSSETSWIVNKVQTKFCT